MARATFKQSYTPDFSNTPKTGKPQTRMPGGGSLIGDGMIQGKNLKLSNTQGKKEGKNNSQTLKKKGK